MPPGTTLTWGSPTSTASVAGRYAFTVTGSIPGIVPVGGITWFSHDAPGEITGRETRSLIGNVADETLAGTASVNADCSGSDTLQGFEGGVLVPVSTQGVIYDGYG